MNNKISREDLESAIFLSYGTFIKLEDKNDTTFDMNQQYRFSINKPLFKYPKEFAMEVKDLLYRNFYWIDTPYRMNEIYSNYDLINKGYKHNVERYGIEITMSDGYQFYFVPDFINLKNKSFFHWFDMSYQYCPNSPREILRNILSAFEVEEEWTLEYGMEDTFEKDYS